MRLPVDPLPPIEPGEDPYVIRRRAPVTALPGAGPRSFPPLIFPHPEREAAENTSQADANSQHEQGQPAGNPGAGKHTEPHIEQERLIDRRLYCRRIAQLSILLDTRSGEDRRHQVRREDDPRTVIDEEV